MPRNEHVLDLEGIAPGALEPDDVPDVIDAIVVARHQDCQIVLEIALFVRGQCAQECPLGMVAAGGETPPSADLVTALDRRESTGRGVRGLSLIHI